jgi:hypothetical protein
VTLRILTPLIAGLALASCATGASSLGGVPLGREFTLKPGETARVQSTDLRVTFVGVVNDSRCPADAVCIQAGDAVLALRVGSADVELRSNSAPVRAVGVYNVRVKRVEPYVYTSRVIPPDDYRAALVVDPR